MNNFRTRICICYIITTILISVFVYTMISANIKNGKKLAKLQDEIDEISHMMVSGAASTGESPRLTEIVDNLIKKRLTGIWDDLYTIKKEIKSKDCPSFSGALSRFYKQQTAVTKTEDRVNYASESLGANIIEVEAQPHCPTGFVKSLFGMAYATNQPEHMLRSSMEPGHCFGFKNNKAKVTIQLSLQILIDQVGIQHIPRCKSPTGDTSSAPKDFSVYGIKSQGDCFLGKFRYDNIPSKETQLFNVKTTAKLKRLRFEFESNHGHLNYTCIYSC